MPSEERWISLADCNCDEVSVENIAPMLWFDGGRIPPGKWPFLRTTYIGLTQVEESLVDSVDLTEGNAEITITGCLVAYRQAILRRVLDLSQAVVSLWNAGQLIGSVVCARALLETLATFHSLLNRAQTAADREDWETIGKLVDCYAFSRSPASNKEKLPPEAPPALGRMVKCFIKDMENGNEKFWDQICEEAHPNGKRLMSFGGVLQKRRFDTRSSMSNEERLFPALYNCLYSCCWLINAKLDFDILCEHIRSGAPPPEDHPLVQEKALIDKVVENVIRTEHC